MTRNSHIELLLKDKVLQVAKCVLGHIWKAEKQKGKNSQGITKACIVVLPFMTEGCWLLLMLHKYVFYDQDNTVFKKKVGGKPCRIHSILLTQKPMAVLI